VGRPGAEGPAAGGGGAPRAPPAARVGGYAGGYPSGAPGRTLSGGLPQEGLGARGERGGGRPRVHRGQQEGAQERAPGGVPEAHGGQGEGGATTPGGHPQAGTPVTRSEPVLTQARVGLDEGWGGAGTPRRGG